MDRCPVIGQCRFLYSAGRNSDGAQAGAAVAFLWAGFRTVRRDRGRVSYFADRVEADQVVFKGAIPGMLRTLDSHSNFFDPKAYALLREGQSGHYYRVGMYVGAPEGKVVVMYPFEGSPAFRAGLGRATQSPR